MAWLKLAKPAFFIGNFVRGFFHGSVIAILLTLILFTDFGILSFS